ncbi:MAG: RNA polymerase subunit sigma-70, partial [Eubacteriales bacterium]|nr:RNA polymerase subunit sigma-70 [Eubacteriales bacterium]
MTNQQKDQITALRSQRFGYATIAKAVGLKKDTVVTYCRKIGLTGTKATDNSRIDLDADFCLQCGALLTQTPGRKRIKFCSDKCRVAWWNTHPEKVNRKAVYEFTCAHCGKPFTAYG